MKWTVDANTACSTEDVSEIYYDSLSTFEAIEFNLSGGSQPQHANETADVEILPNVSFLDFCAGCDVSTGLQSPLQLEVSGFYPNPTSGVIVFEKPTDFIEITDLQGRLVLSHSEEVVSSIDLSQLKSGMYFVRQNAKSSKLIISK
jgi:hypothetical protein